MGLIQPSHMAIGPNIYILIGARKNVIKQKKGYYARPILHKTGQRY